MFLVLRLTNEAEKHVQAVVRRSNFLQDDIDVCQKNCDRLRKGRSVQLRNIGPTPKCNCIVFAKIFNSLGT